jgi:hypothetical protein
MTQQQKAVDFFEFLNPLDGEKYTLPPYQQALYADKIEEFADTIPELPDAWTMFTTMSPDQQEAAIDASQRRLSLLRTMSVLKTLDNHLPEDTPAKAAIIANVNARDFAFIFKVFNEWAASAGEKVEDVPGED